jgi:His/Glu/Gln/Arg/opine family amino acid ABC transporter permease subunit
MRAYAASRLEGSIPRWCGFRAILVALAALALLVSASGASRADDLDQIRSRGTLIIGSDATYPPFELFKDDKYEGFDIDLGNEIGKELGVRTEWVNVAWDGIFAALKGGKFDLVMSDVVLTPPRMKEMAFSEPYFLSGQAIARRKGDTSVSKPEDLLTKRVGVQIETTGQAAVKKLGVPDDRIIKYNTMQLALLDVRNGRDDAAVGDIPALKAMILKGYPELEVAGPVFKHEHYGVVMRLGEPRLLAAVNEALDRIMADGRYARIYRKWIGEPLPAGSIDELHRIRAEGTSMGAASKTGSAFSIRWDVLGKTVPLMARGARMTLLLTLLTLVFGTPLGLIFALMRLSSVRPLRWLSIVYVEVVRGTPMLILIFVVYYVMPAVHISLPQFQSAVIALSLNAAAYISEILRAGIESIDSGQMEAARALGMDYRAAMRWVILPQTIRRVLPPMTNEGVALLKDSSLVSLIGMTELARVGSEQAAETGSPITIYLGVALFYLAMTLPLTYAVHLLERRYQPVSRPGRPTPAAAPAGPVKEIAG